MLKYLLLSLALLVTPVYAEKVCPGGEDTEDAFFAYTVKNKFEVFSLTNAGQEKVIKKINMNRSRNGVPLLQDGTLLYFAKIDPMNTGVVLMYEGCVVPKSVVQLPSNMFATVLQSAGVLDEEILPFAVGSDI